MPRKKTRENYTFDSQTLQDLSYIQLRCRGISKNAAVLYSVQLTAKLLRLAETHQIAAVTPDSRILIDVPAGTRLERPLGFGERAPEGRPPGTKGRPEKSKPSRTTRGKRLA